MIVAKTKTKEPVSRLGISLDKESIGYRPHVLQMTAPCKETAIQQSSMVLSSKETKGLSVLFTTVVKNFKGH